MSEENKRLLKRHFEELWNLGDLMAADEIYAEDYTRHGPFPAETAGPESEKRLVVAWRTAFSGLVILLEDLLAEDDRAVARWTILGTDTGGFMGEPPTGREIKIDGMKLARFAGGKIVESWDSLDLLGLRQQLSPNPVPAPVPTQVQIPVN